MSRPAVLCIGLGVVMLAVAAFACDSPRPSEPGRAPPAAVAQSPAAEGPLLDSVEALESGLDHACALRAGKVYCWGQSLGAGADSSLAHEISGLPPIAEMRSAGRRVCALGRGGELFCWGERLGQPLSGPRGQVFETRPGVKPRSDLAIRWGAVAKLDFGRPITRVAVGLTHICALTDKRDLYCWGSDNGGQLGKRTPIDRPHLMAENVDEVEVGHGWTCHVSGGKRHCKGAHPGMGQLEQQQNLQFPGWQIASCGVSKAGEVYCEGNARLVYGGGPVPSEPSEEAVRIRGIDRVQQLALGAGHACVVRADATVWCWGDDTFNQILGKANQPPAPIELPGKTRRVEAGLHHNCALLAEGGEVVCWGRDQHGQSGGSSEVSKIRVAASTTGRTAPIATIAITEAKKRYELLAGPTPKSLEGTAWSACIGGCGECTYTLKFKPRRRFVAEGSCPSLGATTTWTGHWKRTKDRVYIREKPSPAGTVWEWRLDLRGRLMTGERTTSGLRQEVTGHLP